MRYTSRDKKRFSTKNECENARYNQRTEEKSLCCKQIQFQIRRYMTSNKQAKLVTDKPDTKKMRDKLQ